MEKKKTRKSSRHTSERKIYTIEGMVEKKNPSMRGGYHKRFLKLFEGRYLCFFDPTYMKKPKGTVDLSSIDFVEDLPGTEFSVPGPEHPYVFKAETDQEKQKWVKTLRAAMNEAKAIVLMENGKAAAMRQFNMGAADNSGQIKEDSTFGTEDYYLSEHCLTVKGIFKAIKHELPERAKSRMIYGFLDKKRESKLGTIGKNKAAYTKDDYEMPVMYLPSDMEFNTIYYYTFKNEKDDTKPKGEIKCTNVHKVDKVVKSSTYHQIRLNIGERIFKLRSARAGECDRWIEAITLASNTAKELARSKTQNSRNVSRLIEAYERKELEKVLQERCEIWLPAGKVWDKEQELVQACQKVERELIILIDSFRCKSDFPEKKEKDIEEVLLKVLHERILKEIKVFLDTKGQTLSPFSILQIIDFWHEYQGALNVLDIEDDNLKLSCDRCAVAFANNISQTARSMVDNIINRDLINKEGVIKDNDKYYTSAASDIFNILDPVFTEVYKRKVDSLTLRMLEATREVIRYYAGSATNYVSNLKSSLPHEELIAILNVEEKFFNAMQAHLDKSLVHLRTKESKEAAKNNFGLKETVGQFRNLCSLIETKLANEILDHLKQFNTNFATINFDQIAVEAGEKANEIAQHISLDTYFWFAFQEKLVGKYLQCFFWSLTKKLTKLPQIMEKPVQDKEIYVQRFDSTKSEVFDDIKELLDGNFANIPLICARLKETFPESLTARNILALIKQRTDADKKDVEEMLRYCDSKFSTPRDRGGSSSSGSNKGSMSSNSSAVEESNQEDEDDFDVEAWQKAGGLEIPDNIPAPEEEKVPDIGIKVHLNKEMNGYLNYKGVKRFFAILGGSIFCYKHKRDTLADTDTFPTLSLKEVKSVTSKGNTFTLKFMDTSLQKIEFQTLPHEDPEVWVACIQNNLDEYKSVSPGRKILARPSVRADSSTEVIRLVPSASLNVEKPRKKRRSKKKVEKKESKVETLSLIPGEPKKKGFLERFFCCCFKKKEINGDYTQIN